MNGEDIVPIRRIEPMARGRGETMTEAEVSEEFGPEVPEPEVLTPEPEPRSSLAPSKTRWLERIIKLVIAGAAFLLPIIYLPITPDFLFIKTTLAEVAAVLAGAGWLLSIFIEKRISYKRSPVNFAFLLVSLLLLAGTFFSVNPTVSFWGFDPTGEKTATILSLIVLSFVSAAVLSRADVRRVAALLVVSFLLLSLLVLVSILFGPDKLPSWLSVNPIGTTNALAAVLAVGFVFSAGLAWTGGGESKSAEAGLRPWLKALSWITLASALIALAFLNFRMAWIGLAGIMTVYIALHISRRSSVGDESHGLMSPASLGAAFLVLVISLFFLFYRGGILARWYQPPIEISPSFRATLQIAGRVLGEGQMLGSGPATFNVDYNRFRDQSLNLTNFWPLRFSHGYSFFPTIAATLGVLGVLVFLWFVVVSLGSAFRQLWIVEAVPSAAWAGFGGLLLLFLFWFLYASNLTLNFLIFLFLGMLGAILQEPASPVRSQTPQASAVPPLAGRTSNGARPLWKGILHLPFRLGWGLINLAFRRKAEAEKRSRWRITRRTVEVQAPALNFAVSLFVVFLSAFALVSLYFLGSQYAAEAAFGRGLRALNAGGNIEEVEVHFSRAQSINPSDDRYSNALAQLALLRLQAIVQQVAIQPSAELQDQFRNALSNGVNAAAAATARNPSNPNNWFLQGQLFEAVLPFLSGADQASLNAYGKAIEADPLNPALPFSQGRVYLTVADLLTLTINQTRSGEERSRLEALRADIYQKAGQTLGKSLELKPDYAQAYFLLAQLAIRENNLEEAIARTENTAQLAPADVGVAFQLGVLYYRADRLDEAKLAFERAILFNDNYSNARYFLGLIWDRKGDKDAALSQFQKIAALNPDNDEVKRIMANLSAGRPALAGIVPPAQAPEARREAPVKEKGEEERRLRRR